jgi:hypothetical protein
MDINKNSSQYFFTMDVHYIIQMLIFKHVRIGWNKVERKVKVRCKFGVFPSTSKIGKPNSKINCTFDDNFTTLMEYGPQKS